MRIVVSADALTGLVSRLRQVRSALSHAQPPADADLGADEVAEALGDFLGSWSKRRSELGRAVDDAAGLLDDVVRDFTAADGGLARGLGSGKAG